MRKKTQDSDFFLVIRPKQCHRTEIYNLTVREWLIPNLRWPLHRVGKNSSIPHFTSPEGDPVIRFTPMQLSALVVASAIALASSCAADGASLVGEPTTTIDDQTAAVTAAGDFDDTLRALSGRYEFEITLENEDGIVRHVVGRHIDGNAAFTATKPEVSDHVAVGADSWTRLPGGVWTTSAASELQDPMSPLAAVEQITYLEGVVTISFPGAWANVNVDWLEAEMTTTASTIQLTAPVDEPLTIGSDPTAVKEHWVTVVFRSTTDFTAIVAPA